MNYLARRVGIWYHNRAWADRLFEEIVKNIPQEAIVGCVKNSSTKSITLIDGSRIDFIPSKDCSRGYKFSEVYVQEGIEDDIYMNVIRHCVDSITVRPLIIRDEKDIPRGYRTAYEYYYHCYG